MPWINKLKNPKGDKFHTCKIPNISWRTRKVARDSIWECRKCHKVWTVVGVKQWTNVRENSEMTWSSGTKKTGDYQQIIKRHPLFGDV